MGFLGSDVSGLQHCDLFLRLFVVPFVVATIWITVDARQNNSDYGELGLSNLLGLKYMILAYLMVTSVAAQGEFLYLVYNGDRTVSWSEACGSYGKFCTRLRMALAVHVVAAACFMALTVISGYRVFRRFDPPFVPSKAGEQERT